jgi:hypothetical protein
VERKRRMTKEKKGTHNKRKAESTRGSVGWPRDLTTQKEERRVREWREETRVGGVGIVDRVKVRNERNGKKKGENGKEGGEGNEACLGCLTFSLLFGNWYVLFCFCF